MSKELFDCSLSGLKMEELEAQALEYSHIIDAAEALFPEAEGSNGWADILSQAGEELLCRIEDKAREIRREADAFVLIGVGGSNNAARAVVEALCPHSDIEIIYAGNSTAPSAMAEVLRRIEGKSVYIDIIAKNFETIEPGAAFRVLRRELYRRYGEDAAGRIIATGTRGSRLHRLSLDYGWDFYDFPINVGGRYTALTAVGLLPMAVAGADIRALIKGAVKMRERILAHRGRDNPALMYAAARCLLKKQGFCGEMLSIFEPRLRNFCRWWIQLFGESEGKDDRGLLPLCCEYSEELHSMGQFMQEGSPAVFESFLTLEEDCDVSLEPDGTEDGFSYLDAKGFKELNAAALGAAIGAHSTHIPCLQLNFGPCREETFGEMFYFYMIACVISCRMSAVDPFDQPGVEAYKHRMFEALGKEKKQ